MLAIKFPFLLLMFALRLPERDLRLAGPVATGANETMMSPYTVDPEDQDHAIEYEPAGVLTELA